MVIGRKEKVWEIVYQIKGLYQNNSQITVQQGKKTSSNWAPHLKILLAKKQDYTQNVSVFKNRKNRNTMLSDSKYVLF